MNDNNLISKEVGSALKSLRKKAGYKSYEQFAFDNKMSRIQYWKMENGTNFTLKSLTKILDIHEKDFFDFMSSIKRG